MITLKSSLCVKVVEHLLKESPLLIQDVVKQVEKPDPFFNYYHLLPKILNVFCAKRNISVQDITGVHIPRQAVHERVLFIALTMKLYSPGVYKGIYSIEDGLRHEVAGMLQCSPQWISQQVGTIVLWYNRNLLEFGDIINEIISVITKEIDIKEVMEESKSVELFE